jgi:hypothetical protein
MTKVCNRSINSQSSNETIVYNIEDNLEINLR